jgi:hypothetical protein
VGADATPDRVRCVGTERSPVLPSVGTICLASVQTAAGPPGRMRVLRKCWVVVSLMRLDGHHWCGGQAASAVSCSAGVRSRMR